MSCPNTLLISGGRVRVIWWIYWCRIGLALGFVDLQHSTPRSRSFEVLKMWVYRVFGQATKSHGLASRVCIAMKFALYALPAYS